jgi:hypothetical protein
MEKYKWGYVMVGAYSRELMVINLRVNGRMIK